MLIYTYVTRWQIGPIRRRLPGYPLPRALQVIRYMIWLILNHSGEPMKIELMQGKCVGHARCAAVAPDVFELDDNGYLTPGVKDVPAGQEAAAMRGARACPERAILVRQDGQPSS